MQLPSPVLFLKSTVPLAVRDKTMTDTTSWPVYRVIRFTRSADFHTVTRRAVRNQSGLTLAEAQAHCSDPSTRGEMWFDGFEVMPAHRKAMNNANGEG